MKFTGKLLEPVIDYFTGRTRLVFAPNEDASQVYDTYKTKILSLEIKEYKSKRSLDANAYYWVLVGKLAKMLRSSNSEIHNQELCKYGFPEVIDGALITARLPDTEETEKDVRFSESYHFKPTSELCIGDDDRIYRTYILLRGSHEYNTEEMARLISGLITDCKEAGIPDREIATPDELLQLKERYGIEL